MKKHKINPQLVFIDYPGIGFMKKLKKAAEKNNSVLIHSSEEWYSPEEFKLGKFSTGYLRNNYINSKLIRSPYKVVSISQYLDDHFRSKAVNSVRIPVIMDVRKMSFDCEKHSGKTIFVYAGSPGRKDFLSEIIAGFALVPQELRGKFVFHVIGVNKEQLIDMCGTSPQDIETLGDSLVIHGRLPREETVKRVMAADYTVLLRDPELRYAKAGFPTKVVESLASGTPVMSNITSDLGMYLRDNVNAVLINACSADAVRAAVERAVSVTEEQLEYMKRNARKTAEENFDYRLYIDELARLIDTE